jgi:hypothetical protein
MELLILVSAIALVLATITLGSLLLLVFLGGVIFGNVDDIDEDF